MGIKGGAEEIFCKMFLRLSLCGRSLSPASINSVLEKGNKKKGILVC
jgi:hypothetical protein